MPKMQKWIKQFRTSFKIFQAYLLRWQEKQQSLKTNQTFKPKNNQLVKYSSTLPVSSRVGDRLPVGKPSRGIPARPKAQAGASPLLSSSSCSCPPRGSTPAPFFMSISTVTSVHFFSFNTKTLFILEPAFRIRQVSKYLNVWARDTLHAFHLDRCLNYSGNKYRWWIEKRAGETEREPISGTGPPKCYCLFLPFAKSSAAASAIIKLWWYCPDGFPEYTHHPPRCITFWYPKRIRGQA